MQTTTRFRKLPKEIDAVQLNWKNWNLLCEMFPGEVARWAANNDCTEPSDTCGETGPMIQLTIPTLEGPMLAKHGDWIVRGVAGEFYPVKPEIFAQTYEAVTTSGLSKLAPGG